MTCDNCRIIYRETSPLVSVAAVELCRKHASIDALLEAADRVIQQMNGGVNLQMAYLHLIEVMAQFAPA